MSNKLRIASALVLFCASPLASAQWYVGVGVGESKFSVKQVDRDSIRVTAATAQSVSEDMKDTSYKIFGGHQFTKNWAIEGGYIDLGKARIMNNITAPFVGTITADAKVSGWTLGAVGTLPLVENLSALGKIGTIYSTTKTNIATTGAAALPAGTPANRKHSEIGLTYGLGLQYDVTKAVGLRAEWDSFRKVGNSNCISCTGEANINVYSVGVLMKF